MELEKLKDGFLSNFLLRLKYDGLMPKEKREIAEVVKTYASGGFERITYSEWVWNPNAVGPGYGAWVCGKCGGRNENIHAMKFGDPMFWPGSGICPHCGARFRRKDPDEGGDKHSKKVRSSR